MPGSEEAMGSTEANNAVATILIGVGGFLVSYATFTGNAASTWANASGGCLLGGIVLLLWQSSSRRRRRITPETGRFVPIPTGR